MVRAVDGVDLTIGRGETLGVVGESGCGKTVTAMTVLKLIAMPPGKIVAGRILWKGRDLVPLDPHEMQRIRSREIGIVFQEPMTSLNPVYTVGEQIAEVVRLHQGLGRREAMDRAVEMLRLVHVPAAERRVHDYPHQLSGGMRQRVMIAMALACSPELLIADEPTTALDVTIQAQILDLVGRDEVAVRHGHHADHPRNGGRRRDGPAGRGDVCRPSGRGGAGRRPIRPAAASLYPGADSLDPAPQQDCRWKSGGSRRSPARCRASWTRRPAAASRRAVRLRSAACVRAVPDLRDDRRRPQGRLHPLLIRRGLATMTEPLLRVSNLVKNFPARGGMLAGAREQVHAVDDVSFEIGAGETLGAGRRVRLRQIDHRTLHPAADRADLGRGMARRPQRHRARRQGARRACAAICRSSSRTRSPR